MASHPGTGSTNILGKPTFSPMLYFSRSSPSFPTARIASGLRTASRGVSSTLQIYYPDMVFDSFLNFLKIATQIDNLSGSRSFIGSFIAVSLSSITLNIGVTNAIQITMDQSNWQLPISNYLSCSIYPRLGSLGFAFPWLCPTLTLASSAVLPSAGQTAAMPRAATPNKGWAAPGKPEHICSAA